MQHHFPGHVLAAASHPNPYPYYAELRAGPPLLWDAERSLWIASTAAAVAAVLAHPASRVRPLREPVPVSIVGSPAGEVFGHLVRMNDGAAHASPKLSLERALAEVPSQAVQACAQQQASHMPLVHETAAELATSLNRGCFAVPVSTVAQCMGFAPHELPEVAQWMGDFVACLSPLSSSVQLQAASVAAQGLLDRMEALVARTSTPNAQLDSAQFTSLVQRVQAHAADASWPSHRALLCNMVGLMSQTYEASAGLLGNTVAALAREPQLWRYLQPTLHTDAWPTAVRHVVDAVCRWDAPIQTTRRWLAEDANILGVELPAGAAVFLLLGSANRDALVFAEPDVVLPTGEAQPYFSFGRGLHACPGRTLAIDVVNAALAQWLEHWPLNGDATSLHGLNAVCWNYRSSANARMPVFTAYANH